MKLPISNRPRRIAMSGLAVVIFILIAISGYSFWLFHRPLPGSAHETLFDGITYIRDVRHDPRPLVIHVVTIDLDTPGLRFFVTPGDASGGRELRAQSTSQFLDRYHLQLAINGDFYRPWWSITIFDYYPHLGDPINVDGFASSEGSVYSTAAPRDHPTLYVSRDNRVSIGSPLGAVYNAVSGTPRLLEDGHLSIEVAKKSDGGALNPRTAVALDRNARTLLLFVIDGRQPNYSEGVSLYELADIILEYGGYNALNLDGGGSSTLVVKGLSGQPHILNSPMDNFIPGRERPVGNHLGVYLQR